MQVLKPASIIFENGKLLPHINIRKSYIQHILTQSVSDCGAVCNQGCEVVTIDMDKRISELLNVF